MTSFLVCHKEVNRFSPSRNPAEEAPLAGAKEEGRLLPRPWITRTKPSRLGLAQGGGVVRRGWLSVFSTLAVTLALLGVPLHAQFVYVANVGGGNVLGYTTNSVTGALIPIAGSPFAAGKFPQSVAVDPSGKFAYVVNEADNTISAYGIGPSGALTPISGSPFATGAAPQSVAVDPSGKFAYVANADSFNVSGYTINPATGALTPIVGSPFAAGGNFSLAGVAVDPSGKFAYVTGQGVFGYTIDSVTGALTPIAGSPFAFPATGIPYSVAVHPSGKFAYVTNLSGTDVFGYTIDPATGALTTIVGSPFATTGISFSVAVDPSGKFAYVANAGPDTGYVSGYAIDPATGALTAIAGSPFAAGISPVSVAITRLVPFASSFAKLEIAKHRFDLKESFTLGANSNGINPVTENVTLQIGTFSVTIPPGSFKLNPNGRFAFQGFINGVSMQVQIVPLGNNIFTFKAEGTRVDLTGLTNPVTVVLTIGINTGATTVTAQFQ
jgi:DNA-binding beta-propeller fold protein YncE